VDLDVGQGNWMYGASHGVFSRILMTTRSRVTDDTLGAVSEVLEESRTVFTFFVVWLWKMRHSQWWMNGVSSDRSTRFAENSFPSSKAVPFHDLILAHWFELVFERVFPQPPGFLLFHLLSGYGESPNQSSSSADSIGLWFGFWLFHLGDFSDLVEISFEDGCVGHVLRRLGHL
jgi:hypothetical protein